MGWVQIVIFCAAALAIVPLLGGYMARVFTNERVMLRSGVVSRDRRDVPLNRINDHSTKQSLTDRGFGCGTLTIESAGERGQSVLRSVPDVDRVQTMLNELIDQAVAGRRPPAAEDRLPDGRPAS